MYGLGFQMNKFQISYTRHTLIVEEVEYDYWGYILDIDKFRHDIKRLNLSFTF